MSITGKCPRSYCALLYAEIRAETELQGSIGAAIQISEIKWAKELVRGARRGEEIDVEKILYEQNDAKPKDQPQ